MRSSALLRALCVLCWAAAQDAGTACGTSAAYSVPVKFLVLRNSEYSILKWFAALESVSDAPALDLPDLDVAATVQSYGVPSCKVGGGEELRASMLDAFAQP